MNVDIDKINIKSYLRDKNKTLLKFTLSGNKNLSLFDYIVSTMQSIITWWFLLPNTHIRHPHSSHFSVSYGVSIVSSRLDFHFKTWLSFCHCCYCVVCNTVLTLPCYDGTSTASHECYGISDQHYQHWFNCSPSWADKQPVNLQRSLLTALSAGNLHVTSGFTSQRTRNAESISMTWCLHGWYNSAFSQGIIRDGVEFVFLMCSVTTLAGFITHAIVIKNTFVFD